MDTSRSNAETSTLRHYVAVARRHRWVILQAFVVVTAAALVFSLTQEKRYQGTSQVLLDRQNISDTLNDRVSANDSPQLADRIAQTQADLARSPEVARRTVEKLGLEETPREFLADTNVEPKSNTDILEFSATDGDEALAKRMAIAYANEFVGYRTELDTRAIKEARESLERRIANVGEDSPIYSKLVAKDEELRTEEALQTSNATVVESADKAALVQPLTVRNTIVGAVLGLLLGIGLAFLWDALDTRVRSADEVGEQLHLPLLARLPEPPKKVRDQNRVLMLEEPSGRQSELFRMLRTNLDFALLDREAKTILVTSATQGEGKSTTVANLGVALARSGRRVILVDLDLRRPFMDRFFGNDQPGVTQVALGNARLDDALQRIDLGGSGMKVASNGNGNGEHGSLRVLTSGPIPPDPGEFLATKAVSNLLEQLGDRADVVLVDAPPLLNLGDSMLLSSKVDAILLVTRLRMVRRPMLKELKRVLDQTPGHKLGFVVTGAETDSGYGYGYGYGYGHEEKGRQRTARLEAPLAPAAAHDPPATVETAAVETVERAAEAAERAADAAERAAQAAAPPTQVAPRPLTPPPPPPPAPHGGNGAPNGTAADESPSGTWRKRARRALGGDGPTSN